MNAVAMQIEGPAERLPTAHPSQTISESAAVLQMVERAARDPSVDLDKLERLMLMRERIEAKQAETAFNAAMTAAQADMGRVSADAVNKQTSSRYATYAALDRVLRPIYTSHGFSLSFDEGDSPKSEHIRIVCYVSHESGHTRTYHKDMPADGKGAKGNDVMSKTHAAGAAASYGMRYLLKGIFNVAVGEDDRDGNVPADTVSAGQVERLQRLIVQTGADLRQFLSLGRIDRLEDMPVADFPAAINMLERKAAKQAQEDGR